jgi:hypothetical protein
VRAVRISHNIFSVDSGWIRGIFFIIFCIDFDHFSKDYWAKFFILNFQDFEGGG